MSAQARPRPKRNSNQRKTGGPSNSQSEDPKTGDDKKTATGSSTDEPAKPIRRHGQGHGIYSSDPPKAKKAPPPPSAHKGKRGPPHKAHTKHASNATGPARKPHTKPGPRNRGKPDSKPPQRQAEQGFLTGANATPLQASSSSSANGAPKQSSSSSKPPVKQNKPKPPPRQQSKQHSKPPAKKSSLKQKPQNLRQKPSPKPAKPKPEDIAPGIKPIGDEDPDSDPYILKVNRIVELTKDSTPEEPKLTFDSVNEYLQHISYNIFLEELYESDIFSDLTIEWATKKEEKFTRCTASFSYTEVMNEYVPEKMRHLRKAAFTMGQGIILLRKKDSALLKKPEIWCCSVAWNKVAKVGRKKLIKTVLDVYKWNETKLPVGASSKGFAILPCSAVVTRVMQAMSQLENPSFKDLLLGKTPIKQIFFKNYIGKYTNQLNESQKIALQSALNNKITILKGPPGSGKTSTIYEMILQLIGQLSYYPVLVVAASNLAVDNIAEKLMINHKDDIIRIVSVT
ncbi:unnamed protein product [Ambrosiozyma monospora]|uniref:Unnamed protein product n=1 Tax=Ambrosiozyma monospora TaxID=43982 RepID=A0A9W6YVV1_AMBMO|nr:unnamed protein product [Ambrosiozyma monospora]